MILLQLHPTTVFHLPQLLCLDRPNDVVLTLAQGPTTAQQPPAAAEVPAQRRKGKGKAGSSSPVLGKGTAMVCSYLETAAAAGDMSSGWAYLKSLQPVCVVLPVLRIGSIVYCQQHPWRTDTTDADCRPSFCSRECGQKTHVLCVVPQARRPVAGSLQR